MHLCHRMHILILNTKWSLMDSSAEADTRLITNQANHYFSLASVLSKYLLCLVERQGCSWIRSVVAVEQSAELLSVIFVVIIWPGESVSPRSKLLSPSDAQHPESLELSSTHVMMLLPSAVPVLSCIIWPVKHSKLVTITSYYKADNKVCCHNRLGDLDRDLNVLN